MDDLISRQAAIDALDVLCQEHRYKIPGKGETYSQYNEAWQDALSRAEGVIFDLPSAQPELNSEIQKWLDPDIDSEIAIDKIREIVYSVPSAQPQALIDQLRWERDVAVRQLHDLGYEFGEAVKEAQPRHYHEENLLTYAHDMGMTLEQAEKELTRVTHIAPQRIKGRWLRKELDLSWWYECSECGESPLYDPYENEVRTPFCPWCGAKMEVEDERHDIP